MKTWTTQATRPWPLHLDMCLTRPWTRDLVMHITKPRGYTCAQKHCCLRSLARERERERERVTGGSPGTVAPLSNTDSGSSDRAEAAPVRQIRTFAQPASPSPSMAVRQVRAAWSGARTLVTSQCYPPAVVRQSKRPRLEPSNGAGQRTRGTPAQPAVVTE